MTDQNVESVKAKMDARAAVGLKKYGVTTERTDFSLLDWLRAAQEEAMDQAIYLEAAIRQLEGNEQPAPKETRYRVPVSRFPGLNPADFSPEK
jgi:hypothetical protein